MHKKSLSWYGWIIALALIVLLTACGGGSSGSSTATGGSKAASTPPTTSTNASTGKSTVTFTASGGLNGPYTVSDTNVLSNYSPKALTLTVESKDWIFLMAVNPYSGPKTYTVGVPKGTISLTSLTNGAVGGSWHLISSTCQVIVTSDVDTSPSHATGTPQYYEIKGTFSCPSLEAQSAKPVALNNGQFDIMALDVAR